jgi:serine/threonine protein kinase
MVMELLEGETLEERRLRKGGKLPVDEVLWATDQVLGILVTAHKKGVVHRDIKPENIFLTTKNEIKVLDFGIARYKSGEGAESTKIGSMLGSLHYMPPEQGRGDWDKVGVQTDLWAVGATMFALIAGRPVHDEKDLFSQLQAITRSPAPPLSKYAPEVSEAVALLVEQALQFDAHRRWSDASMMQIALRITYRSGDQGTIPDSDEDVDSLSAIQRPRIFSAPTVPPFSMRVRKP